MKSVAVFLLLICCLAECRKIVPTLDKNANINFINMEAGGAVRNAPGSGTQGSKPQTLPVAGPMKPVSPAGPPSPTTAKAPLPTPIQAPLPTPAKPAPAAKPHTPTQIKPVPVNPAPAVNPITTPGPGSVKQLITFYDSQGKASPIRPYSYSQAVKQG